MSTDTSSSDKAAAFLALHHGDHPLLVPNPWDVGSARLFASMGFDALATTSSGFATTLGRHDGTVSRAEALAYAAALVEVTPLPVTADLERCFADDPDGVSATVRDAGAVGLAGCSIEDFTGNADNPMYPVDLATERVAAAAQAAHAGPHRLVLTARADNYFHGRHDLADTITRLQRYQEAGADVLYAPALTSTDDIRAVVSSVDLPVNVLAFGGVESVAELAALGVARISVGGAFAFAAYGAAFTAAEELLHAGTFGFRNAAHDGRDAVLAAFNH